MNRTFAAFAILAGSLACDATAPKPGWIALKLKDAPGDVVKAVVTIEQIYLQGGENDSTRRVILRDDPVTVDLLTLANSTMDLVDETTIPGGSYGQLRFVVSGAYLEVEAETLTEIYSSSPTYSGLPAGASPAGSLIMPSFAQSGLKVTLPGNAIMVNGDTTVLVVDFDVAQSFGHLAGSANWVMHPSITAAKTP